MCVCAGEFLEEIHQVVESRLNPVSREITDSRVKTREELDALYRKIITYILLRSSMGSPTDDITVQEATGSTLTCSFSFSGTIVSKSTVTSLHVLEGKVKGSATHFNISQMMFQCCAVCEPY